MPPSRCSAVLKEPCADDGPRLAGFLAANDELVIFYSSNIIDTDNGYKKFTFKQWEGVLDIVQKIEKCGNFDADASPRSL